ncbi:acetyl/propionyl-CoA carboxylase, biotin carboxylase subunit fused with biotin carboxyl carrier subunit and carboxyltransferase subunit [Amycolatopsis mediterranei S699]|uniref:biotin carboxylase n=4 Tax=Amycolatopsis mediterranei TaxID=33910 RepID=A0A0H3D793_AMYMU|nr:biotin carboxylase N-terminal domain-containing protein [Amycolatopsis mediterranei]ADJ45943.1 acetyl/propionyl-CoA carboxylase, biotin carboxylase subunit fused with biotin carboxyl carrier subunit and carboxyltransferase subunit [Amycolatopsis mediterranei U32]AEK42724.1 acetyl/propionyl-CoA carboxylase, biotin carboxylase subunit fused with biotin carboxyl carrier subunit and carboxyltransferase subunit [Amycolatopsis mediterranei S699]AFO77654.1 acetyl/propionyl-CoA carboxylase, biotin ca
MFSRVAIVNRGEAAMRLIHAVRDLSAETGTRIETVALYTDADRTATFVREADLAYDLGPASARPYLDLAKLEQALVETKADAAWVGWGFVAEDPAFAQLCEKVGVTFVGPSADAMRKLGDKIGAKLIAEEVGVPVAPWSRGEVATLEDALKAGERIGYPLMLKATAGGGGRGIRMVASGEDLAEAYERTSQEALRAFGSGVVFLERLVTGARHVEVQVISDGTTAWALGVRDCSVQRRNQKIIEESASPVLAPPQTAELKTSAERLAVAVGYRGACTVEFLYHPGEKLFAFLEVNTRLQVEHPITEITTGTDLVKLQLHVAGGGKLEGEQPAESGHAVEARLNAEDPDRDFAPSPGRIARLALPAGPGIRVDTGVSEGDTIPADFDSMIAKIIAYGRDRDEALGRLRRAMAETTVIIEGGATNKSFVLDLLDQPEVIDASADTGWIDRVRAEGRLVTHRHSAIALAAAAIEAYQDEEEVSVQRLLSTAHGGRPQVQHESGRPLDLKLRGVGYRVSVARAGRSRFRVGISAGSSDVHHADIEIDRFDAHSGRILVNGRRFRLVSATHGPIHLVEVDGVTHRVSRDEGGVVRSPAPALVVATPLAVGAEVEANAPILVLESMKMETVLRAPFRARVRECPVSVGSQVETGAPLMRLEPLADGAEDEAADETETVEIELPSVPDGVSAAERVERGLNDLRSLLLGFDVDPAERKRLVATYLEARAELGNRPVEGELELLTVFADLSELSRNTPGGELDTEPGSPVHSSREFFHSYLQSLDVERAGVTESFQAKLKRVLAHYGVPDLERTPELEAAVFRIFLAQQRTAADVAVVSELLRQWLTGAPPAEALSERAGLTLEHLVEATQVRFPAVSDLARGVVFRWFAQPLLRRNRARVYAAVRTELSYLDQHPDAPDRAERIQAMITGSQPLVRLIGQRIGRPGRDHAPLLEVLTRRYYGNRRLSGVAVREAGGHRWLTAELNTPEGVLPLVTTAVDIAALPDALRTLGEVATEGVVADLYLRWEDQPDVDATAERLGALLAENPLPAGVRRVVVTVAGTGGAVMHHHFTFERDGAGFTEDRLIRGLHPQIAQRLQLQRLREFDLTRLPSADEEIYLFKAAAKTNPADERLIAMGQVRDLTPLREADGRLVALPALEDAVTACLDAIRNIQAQRPQNKRFDTNRIMMYVWPPTDLTTEELNTLVQRILPTSVGAGLEEVQFLARRRTEAGKLTELAVRIALDPGHGARLHVEAPSTEPVKPLDDYRLKVLRAARRGTVYPYELTGLLSGPEGTFTEYDLESSGGGVLVPVDRPKGKNTAAIIAGVVTTPTERHPEGVTRVVLLGDPTKSLGALSEPECSRVIAALDLAERMQVPLEWFALSSGARISMSSGTENMDWVAAALKRIVTFTQDGGEINIVVNGINVGAQPYWNAEATMLMHTKGILVMTPDSAMVLTGKQALDFSGGVSAEDNFGIGGYDRVMGPNGQAQYWAPNLPAARQVLMAHYDHTYVVPGEAGPRKVSTSDPVDRDVSPFPHAIVGSDFRSVGEIFSAEHNPDRKKPFDIRTVMRALSDQDHPVLERWAGMADADTSAVQDVHIGGRPVCLVGIESRSVPRRGFPPTDGPDTYTAGTLFPRSSKKTARAINAASGNRPLVVLANLSGFDGSPESLRKLQLEYGAEIGRAIVNFEGPIVFCVISRYHGGAFVVFSKALNPNMTVLALEGSFASVLGGAPAAAVVFAGEVNNRTANDPRVTELLAQVAAAGGASRAALNAQLAEVQSAVRAEKVSEVAAEFDRVHSIQRAVEVGSVDAIISAAELRPRIIEAIEHGLKR